MAVQALHFHTLFQSDIAVVHSYNFALLIASSHVLKDLQDNGAHTMHRKQVLPALVGILSR